MACTRATLFQSFMQVGESQASKTSHINPSCYMILSQKRGPITRELSLEIFSSPIIFPTQSYKTGKHSWRIALALNSGGFPSNSDEEDRVNNGDSGGGLGQTRLGRIVVAGGRQLLEKINAARKNFPVKIFLLLLGFYTANALATVLGQTGDWDVLVAGVVVAAIEGIGMLMYKRKPSSSSSAAASSGRFQSLMVMINYWKAGVCLGLYVDAFKLGS
ncbi:ycf20-like protein [Impatiens glandulifera]|uniref:ycf20-like protein n=1 Tax=Impatiens glandulifera TaxID=253017 RepID=UPI001FB18301|nr:ycf20-like protein [Impatiens glandulifera]